MSDTPDQPEPRAPTRDAFPKPPPVAPPAVHVDHDWQPPTTPAPSNPPLMAPVVPPKPPGGEHVTPVNQERKP